jgi:hypothetical protein
MMLFDAGTRIHRPLRPFLVLLLLTSGPAYAGLDHELGYDKDGLYSQNLQTGLEVGVIAVEVAGALFASELCDPLHRGLLEATSVDLGT